MYNHKTSKRLFVCLITLRCEKIEVQKRKLMAEYVSIDDFEQGWTFFAKKTSNYYGNFSCFNLLCSGCDDWLDCESQNRETCNTYTYYRLTVTEALLCC